MAYNGRPDPRRANSRKDSWLTIDWGKPGPPSKVQGVMDQIAGFIVRDHKLIDQGKTEWRKAVAYRREQQKRIARGETIRRSPTTKSKTGGGGGGGSGGRTPITKSGGNAGFFASLFGANRKKKPLPRSSGTIRRAMTKPGQHRVHSGTTTPRRPANGQRISSRGAQAARATPRRG